MKRLSVLIGVVAIFVLASVLAGIHNKNEALAAKMAELDKEQKLVSAFEVTIAKVRRENADACNPQAFAFAEPPEGLARERVTFAMGNVLGEVDPAAIQLKTTRDGSIEMWVGTSKIGERLSLEACRAIKDRHK